MGRYYAIHDNEDRDVANAIAEHWGPLGPSDKCPTAPTSVAAALADKFDSLAGFFGIGEAPTGSRDPFALRRAALGAIRLIVENKLRFGLAAAFEKAAKGFGGTVPFQAKPLLDFFADRLKVALREKGVRHDLIDAVFALGGEDDLVRLLARVDALRSFIESDDGKNLLVAYRRAANIVKIEAKKDKLERYGVLAPLVNDALGLRSISVGETWFNLGFPVVILPLVALVSIGIHAAWKRGRLADSRNRILLGLGLATALGLAVIYGAYGPGKWLSVVGVVFGLWVIVSSLFDPIDRWRRKLTLSRAIVGMTLAHIGLGVCVIAVSTVESYTVERDIAIGPGETVALGRYAYRFEKLEDVEGPNYDGVRAEVTVLRDGKPLTTLHPEKRNYWVQRSTMTEAGIDNRWNMDLFVALGEDLGAGRWSIRAQLRPLINYVWLAAALMALGGGLAASDRRYRARVGAEETPAASKPGTVAEAT
jgi:hypothetical protein